MNERAFMLRARRATFGSLTLLLMPGCVSAQAAAPPAETVKPEAPGRVAIQF